MSPLLLSGWLITASIVLFAIWRGGSPERWGAIVIGTWFVSDPVYHFLTGPSQFYFVDLGHVIMDVIEVLAIGTVALRANRIWPIWATSAELIAISGHIAMAAKEEGMLRAYWAMTQLPLFLQLLALLLGTIAHRRRLARIGSYRDWRLTR